MGNKFNNSNFKQMKNNMIKLNKQKINIYNIANKYPIIKKHAQIVFLFLIIVILSKLTLRATGDFNPDVNDFLILSIVISFFVCSKKTYYFIMLPISVVISLYGPVGFTYGFPSYQYLASLVATNSQESLEFLSLIPYKSYFYSVLIPFSFYVIHLLSYRMKINPIRNRTYIIISLVILTLSSEVFTFINKTHAAIDKVMLEINELSKYAKRNDWGDVYQTDKTKYDDYILIVGESARRDYFHVYGYPIENTPFLDSTNGTIVNGLNAGGTYTIGSLRLMLTQGNKGKWQPNYNLNIMGMLNNAGFETYWLSNQGLFGRFDTPISSIANKAKHSYFTKSGAYNSKNIPDSLLLKNLQSIVSKESNEKRFIVLHTMGSHPHACDRIDDFKNQYKAKSKINNYIACYVSSIKQTDDFIKSTYEMMLNNDNGRKFSIMYISDHGMVHREVNGEIQLNNNYVSKYHYDIPLIKISSDDNERKVLESRKSGLMFVNGVADWMGVEGDLIEPYDLFDGVSNKQDYGLSKKAYKVDDPAIDITSDLM